MIVETGQILVAGEVKVEGGDGDYDLYLARLHRNGKPDTSFGKQGQVVVPIRAAGVGRIALHVRNKGILLAARAIGDDGRPMYLVARSSWDGALDPSFGQRGLARLSLGDGDYSPPYLLVAGDRPIVAGQVSAETFSMVGLDASGGPDPSFGAKGVMSTTIQGGSVAAGPKGDLAVMGRSEGRWVVRKYSADGTSMSTVSLPPSFLRGSTSARVMWVQEDGKLLGAYTDLIDGQLVAALFRLTVEGTPDDSFGKGGVVIVAEGSKQSISALVSQKDNRIVVGGSYQMGPGFMVRFEPTGQRDLSFGQGGESIVDLGGGPDDIAGIVEDEGTMLVAGTSDVASTRSRIVVVRLVM